MSASGSFLDAARDLLLRLEQTQFGALEEAADICAEVIGRDGLIHAFGTGHSRIPVEELFPRYASFPGFHPIVELSMTFHTQVTGANGQRQAMFIERTEGLAAEILRNFSLGRHDAMLIFSAGGTTAVPIEMAIGAREQGLPVIAVTAVEASRASASGHSSGTRLLDHADVVIDLCTPVGDGMVRVDGLDVPVGPGSTIAAAAVVNELKVRVAQRLVRAGQLPPVITSAAIVGRERSRELFDAAYAEHARRAARVLEGAEVDDQGAEVDDQGAEVDEARP
jgi:uncharacterized phosphosugar-binding protein